MALRYRRVLRSLCYVGIWSVVAWGLTPAVALAQPNTGKVSVSTGLDISHAYFFRGIRQEDQGFIAQPYAEIAFDLFEDVEGLDDGRLTLGFWNSLHSGPAGSGGPSQNTTAWYRSDFYARLSLGLVREWHVDVAYTQHMSPNDTFSTVKELTLSLGSTIANGWVPSPCRPTSCWPSRSLETPWASTRGSTQSSASSPLFHSSLCSARPSPSP